MNTNMRITTERLYIHQLTDKDFELMALIWKEWCPPLLSEDESALRNFLRKLWETTQDLTTLTGLIFLNDGDVFCGRVNIQHIDWERPEVGIDILPEHRNQGYGPEAIVNFVNWYSTVYHKPEIEIRIMPSNAHSIHVFEKLGAEYLCNKSAYSEALQDIGESVSEDLLSTMEQLQAREYVFKLPIQLCK